MEFPPLYAKEISKISALYHERRGLSTAFQLYLAMTAQEIVQCDNLPQPMAWMACQFSSYHKGIGNLPPKLPKGSLLILNDMTPFAEHDSKIIRDQLFSTAEQLQCSGILLDLLREPEEETRNLCRSLSREPPCPVVIPEAYWEKEMHAPVLLPPVPLLTPHGEYLEPWKKESVWLEFAFDEQTVTVTEQGASLRIGRPKADLPVHSHKDLSCSYQISVDPERAEFYLFRTQGDLEALVEESEKLGVRAGIGLYQQFRQRKNPQT